MTHERGRVSLTTPIPAIETWGRHSMGGGSSWEAAREPVVMTAWSDELTPAGVIVPLSLDQYPVEPKAGRLRRLWRRPVRRAAHAGIARQPRTVPVVLVWSARVRRPNQRDVALPARPERVLANLDVEHLRPGTRKDQRWSTDELPDQ